MYLEVREHYFESKLEDFNKCLNYSELKRVAMKADSEIQETYGNIMLDPEINIVDEHLTGDSVGKKMIDKYTTVGDYPNDLVGRIPVSVIADGNCLPRSGSVLAFGSEAFHFEIRCRIIIELVKNKRCYLDVKEMNKGISLPSDEAGPLSKHIQCSRSSMYQERD